MSQKIVEPSEIFTGREEPFHAQAAKANPMMRFVARFFDYALFFACLRLPIFSTTLFASEHWIALEFLAWVPIETLLLATVGTTLGKRLLNIRLQKGQKNRLPFASSLRRSVFVWIKGLGLGLVGLNIICLVNAYYRLMATHRTSWDRDEGIFVSHKAVPKWRFYLTAALMAAGMIYYLTWKGSAL